MLCIHVVHYCALAAPMARGTRALQARMPPACMLSEPADERFESLIRELAETGMERGMVETSFASALAAIYEAPPPPPPPPPPLAPNLELKQPATASDALVAFRAYFSGRLMTSQSQKLVDKLIEDRACVYRFKYTRVYALGLVALCDAFLPLTCIDANDAEAVFAAVCFGLGLEAGTVRADAAAMLAVEMNASDAEALFASPDLVDIATTERFKYSYVFGVGLVLLMRAAGEEQIQATGRAYYSRDARTEGAIGRWCARLNLENTVGRLERDTERPLSIDGIGRFSFATMGVEKPPPELTARKGVDF